MFFKFLALAFAIAGVVMFFKIKGKKSEDNLLKDNKNEVPAVEMKQDVVCGSYVEDTTRYKVRLYDKVYYFCSSECMDKFIKDNTKSE